MATTKLEAFWKRDNDDASLISFFIIQAAKLGFQVDCYNHEYYWEYFNTLKRIYKSIKPIIKKFNYEEKELKNNLEDCKIKCLTVEKNFNKIKDKAKYLMDLSDDLSLIHDELLMILNKSGLYMRTVKKTDFSEGDRIGRARRG